MKQISTHLFRLALGALSLGGIQQAQAAYVPVTLTGFTADVVANGSGTAASSTSIELDAGTVNNRFNLMAPNFVNPAGASPTAFLPASGLINSIATSGLSFQLASYSANNSLRIANTGTGTLTLATPQAAGEVYLLGTSGNGISTVTVTVTFADLTTQVFTAQSFADWFGGTGFAIQGVGRVNHDTDAIDNNTTNPRLYQVRLALDPANQTKLIQSIAFNKTSTTGVLNIMAASLNTLCAGAPNGGTTVASTTSVCGSSSFTLSLTGATADVGISYEWQSSTNGGSTWAPISGATNATYTATGQSVTTQYRARLTCSGQSATSTPVTVTTTAATYATLPVSQSFETPWIDVCNTHDVPSNSWRNSPATGNNSWRREDDPTSAAWTLPNSYLYSPTGSQGTHSARFHSGYSLRGLVGDLDLYVNLSAAGAKRLSFDFINTSGIDSLYVQLSNDGGATFSRLLGVGLSGGTTAGFLNQVIPVNSTSATAVLRFHAVADYGSTDIGLDNIILESATGCLTPAGLSATTTTTTAALSWIGGGSGTYTLQYGPTGFTPGTGTIVSGLTTSPYNVSGLTPGTAYQFYVTLNCTGGTNSGTAGPVSFSTPPVPPVNDDCAGAITVPVQYGTCVAQSSADNTAATNSTGVPAPTCANYLEKDIWFKVTVPASGAVTIQTLPPTAGSSVIDTGLSIYSGTCGNLTQVGCDDDSNPTGAYSLLDLTGRTPGEELYIRVWEYGGGTTGLIAVCVTSPSNCAVPLAPAAGNLSNTTADLSWTPGGTPNPGDTFEIEYGLRGFSPGAGTTVLGLTSPSYQLTGLTANTEYCYYVRQNCGTANGSSAYVGPTCFTTLLTAPANDDPCGATPLTSGTNTASNVGATTSGQPGITTPACSPAVQPQDVWFTLVPSGTSTTLTLTGTAAGMVRIYSTPSCSAGPFTLVACQSSGASTAGLPSMSATGLTAGQRYYVAVSGYGGASTPGTFTISGTALATKAQAESQALLVYPNPSNTGQLTLRLSNSGKGQATLLNALGQAVANQALTSGAAEQTMSTRGLATGVYTLRVQIGSDVLTRKVVLE